MEPLMIEDPSPSSPKRITFSPQPSVPKRFWVGIVSLIVISLIVLTLVIIVVVLGSKEIDRDIVNLPDGRKVFVGLMKKYPGGDTDGLIKNLANMAWVRWKDAFVQEGFDNEGKVVGVSS
mmetsp:Transcript_77817/g.121448  ORF Transcript_77817/g.121448 Transcript_77817/m.121448 type:complete len:120 (-) Transcript_77817:7-366(-)